MSIKPNYPRAIVTCLPVIGPFVSLAASACGCYMNWRTELNSNTNSMKRERIYSICGIVGGVLTIALLATLIILRITPTSAATNARYVIIGISSALVLYRLYQVYTLTQAINKREAFIEQQPPIRQIAPSHVVESDANPFA